MPKTGYYKYKQDVQTCRYEQTTNLSILWIDACSRQPYSGKTDEKKTAGTNFLKLAPAFVTKQKIVSMLSLTLTITIYSQYRKLTNSRVNIDFKKAA